MRSKRDVCLPIELVNSDIISCPRTRLLYWVLAARSIKGKVYGVKRQYLAGILHCHIDRVSKMLTTLRDLRLVWSYHKGPKGLVYYLPRTHGVTRKHGKFTAVPRTFILNKRLRPQARVVLLVVMTLAFPGKGGWYIPMSKLAASCGVSVRTVQRYIPSLKLAGVLVVKRYYHGISHFDTRDKYRVLSAPRPFRSNRAVFCRAEKFRAGSGIPGFVSAGSAWDAAVYESTKAYIGKAVLEKA